MIELTGGIVGPSWRIAALGAKEKAPRQKAHGAPPKIPSPAPIGSAATG